MDSQESEYFERVVQVNRVSKKTKGGDKRSLSVLVVVGDQKGRVGVGLGKAQEVQSAVKKATTYAKKHMISVPLKGRTIPHTILIKKPVELTIEEGNITEIKGNDEAKQLEAALKWAASVAKNPGNVRRICELGIGLNPNASIIGAMIVDDKTLGTAHIGIGSNYWFGGNIYAIIHLDQVFKNPKIYLDGELLKI